MGMFDHYQPRAPVACPSCGAALEGFQGKDGPNLLLVWREGLPAPLNSDVDEEWLLTPEHLEEIRLPERFEYYTACDRCQHWAELTGFCIDGVWTESALGNHLSSGATIPALSVARDWRQCTGCTEAWEHPDSSIRAGCPYCHALTRLEPA